VITRYYCKGRGLRASGFKGIDLNLSDMKPGGIKFESDAVVFRKRAQEVAGKLAVSPLEKKG